MIVTLLAKILRRGFKASQPILCIIAATLIFLETALAEGKERSVFYSPKMKERAKSNAKKYAWAAAIQKQVIDKAQPWMRFSDEELWRFMFGNTITRSWMVWSNGHCPACKKNVPMYTWRMDALNRPWKVWCPHCKGVFPKNDFYKFYLSGLDGHGVFDPELADRGLLFNADHPDPKDPLHKYGVDDGEGYVEGNKRWRFIGAYLIYGQWKHAVLGGIKSLAAAYIVTGDKAYAHKAGVLLDRVADLYPTFDYAKQGLVYERALGSAGYVSVWHDACEETRELALAYDQVHEGLAQDEDLVAFLSQKAEQFKPGNRKTSSEDILRNIEDRILRDALKNRAKINSNYPRTDIAIAIIKTVLDWPKNRTEVIALIDAMIKRATAVDGVTGEKGLANYSAFGLQSLALFLGEYARSQESFLQDVLKRHPRLHQTYRFHIDTWCLHRYYPLSGDSGWFARMIDQYQGVRFRRPGRDLGYSHYDSPLSPSAFTFMWDLYKITGDAAFVQVSYRANDNRVEGLPYDLFVENPETIQKGVAELIEREGALPKVGSVNKEQWHLAILRSGEDEHARAAWLDYDSGGGHGHADGMNLGLFAKGLDLMPDFGYPPVHYGGWGSPRAAWYKMSAAHNTIVVDGRNFRSGAGKTTLWADGERFRAIRASAPNLIGGEQFERTVVMVDISEEDFYVVDIFRVAGGAEHTKFVHSHFGEITTSGLDLKPGEEYGHGAQMRAFRTDASPKPGWSVDWRVDDRYGLLQKGKDVHFRYTDLTFGAQASVAEDWVCAGGYNTNEEAWIPRVMTRRQAEKPPLLSTFAAVIEPYEGKSNITRIRRLSLETTDGVAYPETNLAIEIELRDGRRDIIVSADSENPLSLSPSLSEHGILVQRDLGLRTDGELGMLHVDWNGEAERAALCNGSTLSFGGAMVKLRKGAEFVEVRREYDQAVIAAGRAEDVESVIVNGEDVWEGNQ